MNAKKLKSCGSETVAAYLNEAYGDKPVSVLTHHQKHCYRCALCLVQFAETDKMIEIINRRETIVLTGEFGGLINQYVEYKRSFRLCGKTLRGFYVKIQPKGKYFPFFC